MTWHVFVAVKKWGRPHSFLVCLEVLIIFRRKFLQNLQQRFGGMFWEIFRRKFLQNLQQRFGGMFWEIFRRIFEQGSQQKFSTKVWRNVLGNI
jgi:hypothetical protein